MLKKTFLVQNNFLVPSFRLETMVLMGCEMPLGAIRRQIGSAVDIIIHLGRIRDRSRKVLEVCEVIGVEEGEVQLQPLFLFREEGEEHGKIKGDWIFCHPIQGRTKLALAGCEERMRQLEEQEKQHERL